VGALATTAADGVEERRYVGRRVVSGAISSLRSRGAPPRPLPGPRPFAGAGLCPARRILAPVPADARPALRVPRRQVEHQFRRLHHADLAVADVELLGGGFENTLPSSSTASNSFTLPAGERSPAARFAPLVQWSSANCVPVWQAAVAPLVVQAILAVEASSLAMRVREPLRFVRR
jgi:hypothetical protein